MSNVSTFPRRGVYLHLCWNYFRPWSPRRWSDADWRDFFDWLVGVGYNLVMIWPLVEAYMESQHAADQAAFRRLNALVVEAKRRHPGLEVWGTMLPNCVTEQCFTQPLWERDMFSRMRPVDPRDTAAMAVVERRREAALACLPDFDGWTIIDGDPGGWPNLPVSAFVGLMVRARAQVTRFGRAGAKTKLIYWMWTGWGDYFNRQLKTERWREYIGHLDERIGRENWHPLAAGLFNWEEAGQLIAALGRCGEATRLFYGPVEGEPSPPFTFTDTGCLDEMIARARAEGPWSGFMVNAQTHLLQLPRLWYSVQLMQGRRPDPARFLDEAGATVGPGVADAWRGLRDGTLPYRREIPVAGPLFAPEFFTADAAQQCGVLAAGRELANALRARELAAVEAAFDLFLERSYDRYRCTGYYGALNGSAFFQHWNYAGMPPHALLDEIRQAWTAFYEWGGCELWGALGQLLSRVHERLTRRGATPLLAATMVQQLLGDRQPPYYLTEKPAHA